MTSSKTARETSASSFRVLNLPSCDEAEIDFSGYANVIVTSHSQELRVVLNKLNWTLCHLSHQPLIEFESFNFFPRHARKLKLGEHGEMRLPNFVIPLVDCISSIVIAHGTQFVIAFDISSVADRILSQDVTSAFLRVSTFTMKRKNFFAK